MKKLTFLILFATQFGYAQSSIVTKTIDEIEFEQDTIKSVFNWIANNIQYDVNKLKEIEKRSGSGKVKDFKTEKEFKQYLLKDVVNRKKGVCQGYSLLFDAIVSQLGFKSYIIEGYTKNSKGRLNRKIGHTWNAVSVNGSWRLYDPTWGAGYVKDGKRFVKSFEPQWYDVKASEMVKTHMPFDPMWQLLDSLISYKHFENPANTILSESTSDYKQLIELHERKSEKEQMQDKVNRSHELGDGSRLIEKWRTVLKKKISLYGINSQSDLLDNTKQKFEESVILYNDYISAKNRQFKGKKWTIEYAEQNLVKVKDQMKSVYDVFSSIDVEDRRAKKFLSKSMRESKKLLKHIDIELKFIDKLKAK